MSMISRTNLAEQVRDALATKIVRGDIAPGERLVEQSLAKEFGTSQTPIREALRLLEAARLVESIPHRGTRVRRISDRELLESHVTRGILEQGAARTAAAVFARSPHKLEELRDATTAALAACIDCNAVGAAQENRKFHALIVEACGNRTLFEQWQSLDIENRGLMSTARTSLDAVGFMKQHWPIIEALSDGDGETAGRLLLEHALHFLRIHDVTPEDWAGESISETVSD